MKDWVGILTAIIQLVTAVMLYQMAAKGNKKGTKKRRVRRRR
ncbi:hypothetical protein [Paenibacillus uliginis]|nr:hypothetical protein [Paenibacillus uliginis]